MLILIRHPESTKNVRNEFAGAADLEQLTEYGRQQSRYVAEVVASALVPVISKRGTPIIVSSRSRRAREFASELATAVGTVAELDDDVRSIDAGNNAGSPESVVRDADPEFFQALTLYRAGVLSSYSIPHRGEQLRHFERRVTAAIDAHLERAAERPLILSAHRSTITAALIHCARLFHGYPAGFFGFVDLPLSCVSVVETGPSGRIVSVAHEATDLAVLLESLGSESRS